RTGHFAAAHLHARDSRVRRGPADQGLDLAYGPAGRSRSLRGALHMLGLVRITAAAIALTAATASTGVAADPYNIDVIIEQTGSNAFAGHDYQTAMQVYEQLANRTGGIAGRPLHFEFHDDQTNPVVAVQLATGLIAKHPAVIVGGAIVSTCAAIAALATDGPVDYCLSPGFNPKPNGYAFAASAGLDHIVAGIIRF